MLFRKERLKEQFILKTSREDEETFFFPQFPGTKNKVGA